MKSKDKNKGKTIILWISSVGLVAVTCFMVAIISESQKPTIFLSSGIVAIISAFLGVVLTVIVTQILLAKQSEMQKDLLEKQSETESQKDKDVKIHEHKISVYSAFSGELWKFFDDTESNIKVLDKKYIELKQTFFDKLVFFLNQNEIKELTDEIKKLNPQKSMDFNLRYICKITNILQKSLDNEHDDESGLANLYNAFIKTDEPNENKHVIPQVEPDNNGKNEEIEKNIAFWHFNILGPEQLEAFRNDNWILSLIEYGEEWRTNTLKQVKPDDVILLFKRGGEGYIGAFRATGTKIIYDEEWKDQSEEFYAQNARFDIYNALENGYRVVANIIVEPIAYNYKGVGYWTIRRRTICKMTHKEELKFLLTRLSGNFNDVTDDDIWKNERLSGKDKFEENKTLTNIDFNYFNNILKKI